MPTSNYLPPLARASLMPVSIQVQARALAQSPEGLQLDLLGALLHRGAPPLHRKDDVYHRDEGRRRVHHRALLVRASL